MQIKHKLIIFSLSLLLSYSIFEFQSNYYKSVHQEELFTILKDGTKELEAIGLEVKKTFTELEKHNFQACDKTTLLNMNKQLFWSNYVKDIGFFEGDTLLCSTGLGILDKKVVDKNPDFIDSIGNSIWLNQKIVLFSKEISAVLIRNGRYNVVIEKKYFQNILPDTISWELIFNHEGNYKHISGTQGIFNEYIVNQASFNKNCSHLFPYCVIVRKSLRSSDHSHQIIVLSSAVISILFFFLSSSIMHWAFSQHHSFRSRILRGIKNNAFYIAYQPIIELKSGNIVGCEALARFKDKKGEIFPDQFIPIIRQEKITWKFTHHLIHKIFNDVNREEGIPSNFKININFFPQDISSEQILDLLNFEDIKNAKVKYVVEVTEDEQLNHDNSSKVLSKLQQSGLGIAIDDFGTGYSNLKQLQSLDCHTLKIDRSFISEMEEGSIKSTLIPHIVDIAQKINANVVAEGVENQMQMQSLLAIGVQFGQGWLFGRPMSLSRVVNRINFNK